MNLTMNEIELNTCAWINHIHGEKSAISKQKKGVIIIYFMGYVYRLIIIAHVDARENW